MSSLRLLALAVLVVLGVGFPHTLEVDSVGATSDSVQSQIQALPNVLLIVTDDQRAGTELAMPTVAQRLIDQGVRFTNAFVPTSLCCPSRASLLTGKYAHAHGAWFNLETHPYGGWSAFSHGGEESSTLATELNQRGYRTGYFGKYVNSLDRAGRGFIPPGWDKWEAFFSPGNGYNKYLLTTDPPGVSPDSRPYSTTLLADRLARWIRNSDADEPLFAVYAPFAPHSPYLSGNFEGAAERLGVLEQGLEAAKFPNPGTTNLSRAPFHPWVRGKGAVTAGDIPTRQMDTLMGVDNGVSKILAALDGSGRSTNTIVVYVSDNGMLWGEKGLVGKENAFDMSIRVPLVISWPGHFDSGDIDTRVVAANVDVFATLMHAVGSGLRRDGNSLLGGTQRTGLLMESVASRETGRPPYCGWRTRDKLYIAYSDGFEELIDYDVDPFEARNFAAEPSYSSIKAELRAASQASCIPVPPGFSWAGQAPSLGQASRVRVTPLGPFRAEVSWRAPSLSPTANLSFEVVSARNRVLCAVRQVSIGLKCTISVRPEGRVRVRVVTIAPGMRTTTALSRAVQMPPRT